MKNSRPLTNSIKLLLTLLFLVLVFRSVDISRISRDLRSFSGTSLVLLLLLCWAGQLLCSERWRIFAASLEMRGSYRSFVQVYFAGMFFNIGLPSLVGGDLIKAYLISKKNSKPLRIGLASVLQDRGAGLIALLTYGSLAILISPISWRGFPLWSAYVVCWTALVSVLWIVFKGGRLYRRFLDPGSRNLLQKALRTAADFHQALGNSGMTPGAIARVALYSFLYSGLMLWVLQQVTAAAGHTVGIVPFSALCPLITLGTMLPITLGGIGLREWLYVEALSLVGVPRNQGLVISLATSALFVTCNLAGIIFLPAVPKELRPQSVESPENTAKMHAADNRIPRANNVK